MYCLNSKVFLGVLTATRLIDLRIWRNSYLTKNSVIPVTKRLLLCRNSILGVENVLKRLNLGLYGGNIVSGIAFLNEIDANSTGKVSIHHANFF